MEFIKEESEDIKMEFIKEESEDMKMEFIKEESEDMTIEETFRVKHEETEEHTGWFEKLVEAQNNDASLVKCFTLADKPALNNLSGCGSFNFLINRFCHWQAHDYLLSGHLGG